MSEVPKGRNPNQKPKAATPLTLADAGLVDRDDPMENWRADKPLDMGDIIHANVEETMRLARKGI